MAVICHCIPPPDQETISQRQQRLQRDSTLERKPVEYFACSSKTHHSTMIRTFSSLERTLFTIALLYNLVKRLNILEELEGNDHVLFKVAAWPGSVVDIEVLYITLSWSGSTETLNSPVKRSLYWSRAAILQLLSFSFETLSCVVRWKSRTMRTAITQMYAANFKVF